MLNGPLRPGDIIFTGTPEGVIQGKPKDKQVWLKPGDKIACSLENSAMNSRHPGVYCENARPW